MLGVLLHRCSSLLAALMVYLDSRLASQAAAQVATATEMQMLSQRLARGSRARGAGPGARASSSVQDSAATASVPTSRRWCKGGTVTGVSVDVEHDQTIQSRCSTTVTDALGARRRRTPSKLIDNQQSADVARRRASRRSTRATTRCSSCRSRPRSRLRSRAARLREVDFTNQLAVLSQRIAKNANSLVSSDEIDPEVAFLLGKDTGTFRDIAHRPAQGQRQRCA